MAASLTYQDSSRMLFVPPISDLDGQCGLWSRAELETMDQKFVVAVEAAFQSGLESRAAASSTVRVKSPLNGSQRLAEESAIGAAWAHLCDRRGEVSASEIVGYVRERCPDVDVSRIRFGIEQRLRRGAGW